MGRKAATWWHVTFSIAAGVLYFFFVLPRWPELMGDTSHTLGTVARIVAGIQVFETERSDCRYLCEANRRRRSITSSARSLRRP